MEIQVCSAIATSSIWLKVTKNPTKIMHGYSGFSWQVKSVAAQRKQEISCVAIAKLHAASILFCSVSDFWRRRVRKC